MIRENNIALICSMIMGNEVKTKPRFFLTDKRVPLRNEGCKPCLLPLSSGIGQPRNTINKLSSLEGIEGLIGVADEWQAHLGFL